MNYWKKLSAYDVNSIKRYASGFPLDEEGNATAKCLDGEWDFRLVENPSKIPQGYESVGATLENFNKIKVPSNWQIQGHGQPIYTNYVYPYALSQFNIADIPHVKARYNEVGCYVTEFEVQESDRDVYLRRYLRQRSVRRIFRRHVFSAGIRCYSVYKSRQEQTCGFGI